MSRMKQKYNDIVPALREELEIKNAMQTPKLEKIVISVGIGEEGKDNKLTQNMADTISLIAGQKPSLQWQRNLSQDLKPERVPPVVSR